MTFCLHFPIYETPEKGIKSKSNRAGMSVTEGSRPSLELDLDLSFKLCTIFNQYHIIAPGYITQELILNPLTKRATDDCTI